MKPSWFYRFLGPTSPKTINRLLCITLLLFGLDALSTAIFTNWFTSSYNEMNPVIAAVIDSGSTMALVIYFIIYIAFITSLYMNFSTRIELEQLKQSKPLDQRFAYVAAFYVTFLLFITVLSNTLGIISDFFGWSLWIYSVPVLVISAILFQIKHDRSVHYV